MKYLLLFLLCSCATRSSSSFYTSLGGALICGTIGTMIGGELSPDQESVRLNQIIGASTGSSLCAIGGYYLGDHLYQTDPRNQELEPIRFDRPPKLSPSQQSLNTDINGINLSDLRLREIQVIDQHLLKGLPKPLREKIKTQQLIKYKIYPQTVKTKDGRLLYYSGGTAIEHRYKN